MCVQEGSRLLDHNYRRLFVADGHKVNFKILFRSALIRNCIFNKIKEFTIIEKTKSVLEIRGEVIEASDNYFYLCGQNIMSLISTIFKFFSISITRQMNQLILSKFVIIASLNCVQNNQSRDLESCLILMIQANNPNNTSEICCKLLKLLCLFMMSKEGKQITRFACLLRFPQKVINFNIGSANTGFK